MKKTVLKVLSLVLVVGMLCAFTSCTQQVLVRFVDKDGNDLDLSGIVGGGSSASSDVPATQAPATQAPATEAPATEAPATEAPAADTPATEAPATEAPATDAPATDAPATEAPAASGVPSTTDEIAKFYGDAVNRVKNGEAGYVKREWQAISNLNITGNSMVDGKVTDIVGGYMTTEDAASDQNCEKGSDEAKNRFPGWYVTDTSEIASATCTQNASGNYAITITSTVDDTPAKEGSKMGRFTNSFLAWEDIKTEIDANVSILKEYDGNVHLMYSVTIEAEITPDGKFVSMKHTTPCDIKIGHAKILIVSLDNKEAHLDNFCTYTNFAY